MHRVRVYVEHHRPMPLQRGSEIPGQRLGFELIQHVVPQLAQSSKVLHGFTRAPTTVDCIQPTQSASV